MRNIRFLEVFENMADTKKTVQELEKEAVKKVTDAGEEVVKAAAKAVESAKPAVEKVRAGGRKAAKATKEKAARTATKAKAAAKRVAAAVSAAVYVQYNGGEKGIDELVEAARADFRANHKRTRIEDLKLYIVPEKGMVYYVVNDREDLKGEFQY